MDVTSDLFCAWAAGFFDGEGCVLVTISRSERCRHGFRTVLQAHVTQTSTPCLELFKSRWGGKITTSEYRCPTGRRWAVQHRWDVKNGDAVPFLKDIFPYAVVKREQIAAALRYPLLSPDGRKYGNTTNPIPEDVQNTRVAISHELRALRASSKVLAKEWVPVEGRNAE